jgi:predicted ATPase
MRQELAFQKAMGVTMMAARGWGAQEVSDAYTRALELCERLGDERELFVVLRGQGQFHMIRGEPQIARGFAERCLTLARTSSDPGLQLETHHLFWGNSFFMGDCANAVQHSASGMALYERERDHPLTYVYSGHDPGVCCRCFSALLLWQQGLADQAVARAREALALAEAVAHPLTIALACWGLAYLHLFRREPEPALQWAEREIAVCEEYLLPLLRSQGLFQRGWALAAMGETREGIALMEAGVAANRATGSEMGLPYLVALLGEAYAGAGDSDRGLRTVEEAMASARANGTLFHLSEMQRLKGLLLSRRRRPDLDQAEACAREALALAEAQHAPMLALRAATSLADLLRRRRRAGEGKAILAALVEQLCDGADSTDLMEARAALEA